MPDQAANAMEAAQPLLEPEDSTVTVPELGVHTQRTLCSKAVSVLVYPFRYLYNNGVCCCLVAQLLFSIIGILFKELSRNGVPILQILFIRSSFVVCAAFTTRMFIRKGSFFGPKRVWPFLILRATIGPVGMVCYFASLPMINVGDAVSLGRLSPVFTVFIAFLLRWEALNWIMGIGALGCALGGVVITHPPIFFGGDGAHWSKESAIGYGLALISSFTAACSFLLTAKMGTDVSEFTVLFSNHTPSVIWMGICLCFSFPSPPVWFTREITLLFLGFLPAIFAANVTLTRGVQLCKGVQAACLQTSGIIFSYALAQLILGEKITVFAVSGSLIVIAGIWTQSWGKSRAKKQATMVNHPETPEKEGEDCQL